MGDAIQSKSIDNLQSIHGVSTEAIPARIAPKNVDFDADNLVDAILTEAIGNLQSVPYVSTEDTPVRTILVRRSSSSGAGNK